MAFKKGGNMCPKCPYCTWDKNNRKISHQNRTRRYLCDGCGREWEEQFDPKPLISVRSCADMEDWDWYEEPFRESDCPYGEGSIVKQGEI